MSEPQINQRLERLEDAQAYADRATEQLSEQVIDVFRKIEALDRRLRGLESRLEALDRDDATSDTESADDHAGA